MNAISNRVARLERKAGSSLARLFVLRGIPDATEADIEQFLRTHGHEYASERDQIVYLRAFSGELVNFQTFALLSVTDGRRV